MTRIGLRWLGHASVVLDLAGTRLLTDPLLRPHAGLLRRRPGPPLAEHWADPDVVLISHLHHDHAEIGSLRLLAGRPVVAQPANAHWLVQHDIGGAQGVSLHDWWSVPDSPVRVRPVTAVHQHRPMPHRPNATNGFLVVTDDVRIWFAGDTEPFPAMRDLPELAGGPIDLALVPVGGWGPRLSGGHMDPVQAAAACALVGARWSVPVHWGTLHPPVSRRLPPGWMDRAGPAFAAALAREGLSGTLLEPGERVDLDL